MGRIGILEWDSLECDWVIVSRRLKNSSERVWSAASSSAFSKTADSTSPRMSVRV